MITNQAENDRMIMARLKLIRSYIFFGCIGMQMEIVEDAEMEFAMATDGKKIFYNPNMTPRLSTQELVAVVAHEICHRILLHHLRQKNRKLARWNWATDHVVNLLLSESFKSQGDGIRLPEWVLMDRGFVGMNSEEVYGLAPEIPEPEGGKYKPGPGQFDEVRDGTKGMTESEIKAEEAKIKSEVQNAAALARKAGQMSGAIERLVEALCNPKADWRSLLRDFLTEKAEIDYNWAQPHQRMLHQYGIISPTLDGEKLGRLVLINDASGSCSREQEQFASELSDILSAYECEIWVVHHDTKVTGVDRYESSDLPIILRPCGFGGTCAASAYAYAVEEFEPDVIVSLTDAEMNWSAITPPGCPVLVACTEPRYLKDIADWAVGIDIS